MKMILLVGIFSLLLANVSADQTITCGMYFSKRIFHNVTIGPDGNQLTIKTDPENVDASRLGWVEFVDSSIHSVPREIFTKFPNIKYLHAPGQNIQEIKFNTFWDGKRLRTINLSQNSLTTLHRETFKGDNFQFSFFIVKILIFFKRFGRFGIN
jgi:hypothetical protein